MHFNFTFKEFLIVIIFLYIYCAPIFEPKIYHFFLFVPIKLLKPENPPNIAGIDGENIFFESNKNKLNAWYYKIPNARKTVLLSHGNGGNLLHRVELIGMLIESGVSVFAYDYQGYGFSTGEPSLKGLCLNGLDAYDYLIKNLGLKPNQVILYGESLGTGISCYIAKNRDYDGIILQSGFSSLATRASQTLPFIALYPKFMWPEYSLDNLAVMQKPHKPLLLIHGKLDEVVGFDHFNTMSTKAIQPLDVLVLPNTHHTDIYQTAAIDFVTKVKSFVNSLF